LRLYHREGDALMKQTLMSILAMMILFFGPTNALYGTRCVPTDYPYIQHRGGSGITDSCIWMFLARSTNNIPNY
jgi:hypothetical protein